MNNTTITQRLFFAFGLLILMVALLGGTSLLQVSNVNHEVHNVTDNLLPKQKRLADLESDINEIARASRNLLIMDKPEDLAAQRRDIETSRKDMAEALAVLDKTVVNPDAKQLLSAVHSAETAYLASLDRMLAALAASQTDQARSLLLTETRGLQLSLIEKMGALTSLQNKLIGNATASIDQALATTQQVVIGMVALGLVVGITLALAIIRSITRPLNEAVGVANAIAEGDLTVSLRAEGRSETAVLLRALGNMKDNLARVVGSVRGNAESVATASAQIAQGNQDLSSRTEQQASSLQQTAASMEELGSTVKQNADNARQANQLAQGASTVAVQGGEVVNQVVATMKGINDSSRQIADIINVIDGIAFQTNILALNAAVEAARAGEQGRGFAVVAGEVRSLAQRSAQAAKEIKSLIGASVERVEQGTALVDRAGTTMQEVVSSIRRVTDIMGEISAASNEQSTGVAQVGDAVSQMDQVTQQNAALVEESAAAAESLKSQATQLVQAVAVFKLSAGGGHASPVATHSAMHTTAPAARHTPAPAPKASPRPVTAVSHHAAQTASSSPAPSPAAAPAPAPTRVAAAPAPAPAAAAAASDEWTSF
jgi:methyl-accepting chemotaxis protein